MGRSRGNFHSDEDPAQRSRRKKNASSGENLESAAAGPGTSEGKKALYHCNYCNKDITGKIRIKCAMCPDFDLCIECFSVGAEVTPHKSNHPYRVMDNLSFPLICPDWNADDEILLLEVLKFHSKRDTPLFSQGIEMYGFWNWAEVAEHVGTKTKKHCIEHYASVYMHSPYFPLPDMSHVVGKNRKELLAMAKGQGDDKKAGISVLGDLTLKEESPFSPPRIKAEDPHKVGSSNRLMSSYIVDVGIPNKGKSANKKASKNIHVKDGIGIVKVEDPQSERSFKGPNIHLSGNDGPSLVELSGYNPKRHEFDPEYDNDAEQLLAEMEFKEIDNDDERELKLRVLRIYSKRLDERKRRKEFILERNLLYPNPLEKDLSPEERAICHRYDVYMRFHTKEEHEELIRAVLAEHRMLKRIQELKEARAAGCRTSAEADMYLEQKKREAEESARRVVENSQPSESAGKDLNSRVAGQAASGTVNEFDMIGFNGTDLLSEAEKQLCCEMTLAPRVYMKMQEMMSLGMFSGSINKKADAHHLFQIEPTKVDRVYDMLVKKGIALP